MGNLTEAGSSEEGSQTNGNIAVEELCERKDHVSISIIHCYLCVHIFYSEAGSKKADTHKVRIHPWHLSIDFLIPG